MTRLTLRHYILQFACSMAVGASAQFNLAFQPSSTYPYAMPGQWLSDGSILCGLWTNSGGSLHRITPMGTVEWSKTVHCQSASGSDRPLSMTLSDPAGGSFLLASPTYMILDDNTDDTDTMLTQYTFGRIDLNGDVTHSWGFTSRAFAQPVATLWPSVASWLMRNDGAGGMYLLTDHYDPAFSNSLELVRTTSAGEVLWARSIGAPSTVPGPFPTYEPGVLAVSMASDPDGNLVIGLGTDPPLGRVKIIKVSATGDLLWSHFYQYTNSLSSYYLTDIHIRENGDILFTGGLDNFVTNGTLLVRLHADGSVAQADLYPFVGAGAVDDLPDGDILLHERSNIVRVDVSGVPVLSAAAVAEQDGLEQLVAWVGDGEVKGQELLGAGLFIRTHQQTGYTIYRPTLRKFDLDNPVSCFLASTQQDHFSIPIEIIIAEPDGQTQAVDITDRYAPFTGSFITTVEAPEPVISELCAFITGQDDVPMDACAPLVRNSLISSGSVLVLNEGRYAWIELLDIRGRQMRTVPAEPIPKLMPTEGLSAGLYVVRGLDADGIVRAMQKVMIH